MSGTDMKSPRGRLTVHRADAWGIEKCYCIWTIYGLKEKLERGTEVVSSEKFRIKEGGDTEWQLNYLVKDQSSNGEARSGLYLQLLKGRPEGMEVNYRIGVLNRDEREDEVHTPKTHRFDEGDNWGMALPFGENLIQRSGPHLTLFCEITATDWGNEVEDPAAVTLASDLRRMLSLPTNTDARVMAADAELPVHRALLWARLGREESELDLGQYPSTTVKDYLECLYTGDAPSLQTASRILPIAASLGPQSLLSHCNVALYKKMKLKNASFIFEIASDAGVERLKEEVLKYMIACPLSVKLTDWEEFKMVNQDLAMKVLMAVSTNNMQYAIQ